MVVEAYGSKNPELVKIYDYAIEKQDEDIMFLLANMANKSHIENVESRDENDNPKWEDITVRDVVSVNADAVIASVLHSRKVWAELPWAKEYPEEYFREYVLPYQPYDATLRTPSKEELYAKYFEGFDPDKSIVENASMFLRRSSENDTAIIGLCDNWTRFAVTAMRAIGLPAAEHAVIQWGDFHVGHSVPALMLPDGKFIHFEEPELPKNTLTRAMPKLFRKMYSTQNNTVIYKYRKTGRIPSAFSQHDLKDVTDEFALQTKTIKIKVPKERDKLSNILYLSVFSRNGWSPAAYAEKKDRTALFEHIGTGHQKNDDFIKIARDAGEGIVYLPGFYIGSQVVPVGYPIIVGKGRTRTLKPDTGKTQTMVLPRKFPLRTNTLAHLYDMIGGVIEVSPDDNFEECDVVHTIYETPKSTFQTIEVESDKEYKFVRYRMPSYGKWSIAEMKVFDKNGDPIPLDWWHPNDEFSNKFEFIEQMSDGKIHTYITTTPSFDIWGGVRFKEHSQIGRIEFCPRTAGNDILPGDEYELFYWDDEWVGMGRQIANGYELTYENVPSDALYWLRNYTQGTEERPFTYENGKQIWW